MTFDPFGDFEELGYLRNIAGFKDLAMVKALEHGSFQRNLARAMTELADAKFIEYKHILNIHKTLFGDLYPWAGQDRWVKAPLLLIRARSNVLTPSMWTIIWWLFPF